MVGKLVVLVSGSGSNMESLIAACRSGSVPGEVVGVAADRKCRGLEVAADEGIETALVEFSSFDDRTEWDRALLAEVSAWQPDLVVSAGFMRILAPSFVDAFPDRIVNTHPALLPSFPGAHAVRDALEFGVKVTGATVHLVDHEVDHGPILLQEAVAIEDGDTEESLHERIKAVEHRLLPEACRIVLERSGSEG